MKSSADRIANSYQSPNATGVVVDASRTLEGNSRMYKRPLAALTATALSIGTVASAPAVRKDPLDAATLSAIKSKFGRLMEVLDD
jgi:hypothetical protein